MTPPREVWVLCDKDGWAFDARDGQEGREHMEDEVQRYDRIDPFDAPHTVTRYVLPPSLLTEAQKEALKRYRDSRERVADVHIVHDLYAEIGVYEAGVVFARWLLAQDDRIRGTTG